MGEDLQFSIRPMLSEDVEQAVDCFSDQYDVFDPPATVRSYLSAYPDAFFIAVTADPNDPNREQVIGVCASPIGPQDTAFFGLYGLRAEYRGRGVGTKLFQRCLDYIGPERNIGLYAAQSMQQKYMERGGFTIREHVSSVTCAGIPRSDLIEKLQHKVKSFNGDIHFVIGNDSTESNSSLVQMIINFDQAIHCESRDRLIHAVLNNSDYSTCAIVLNEQIQGYGCLRRHSRTSRFMLGPIYANNYEIALQIVTNLLARQSIEQIQSNGIIIHAIDCHHDSMRLATEELKLEKISKSERLFRERPIKINYNLIYGLFSCDFSV